MENRDLIPNSLKIYYNSVFIISLSQYVLLKDLQEKCVANYQGIIDFFNFSPHSAIAWLWWNQ